VSAGAWATPGSGSDDAGPADAAGLVAVSLPGSRGAGVAVARGDARAPARDPLVDGDLEGNPLGRLGVSGPGGVLDGGFELLRFRFRRLVGLTAVLLLPLQLAQLAVSLTVGAAAEVDSSGVDPLGGLGGRSMVGGGWVLVFVALRALALFVLGIAVGHLVQGWSEGRDPGFGEALRFAASRCWVAPVVVVVAAGVKMAGACLGFVGWFLGDALFFIAGIVAGAERTGPLATIGRSVRLTRSAYGLSLVVCVGGFVIAQVLQVALTVGPLLLLTWFQPPEGWMVAAEQAASLVLLVTVPLTACIAGRAYVELRCRAEGLDLRRRQEARGLA
jgi:hypothetical protein